MLLCDGRGCSHSVPITFRNRKNKMYHEQDYFCETPLQLCNSKCFKDTSGLWHVYVHQTSFDALPIAGESLHPFSHLLVPKVFCSRLPPGSLVKVEKKDGLETSPSGGAVPTSGSFLRDRRLTGACGKRQALPEDGLCLRWTELPLSVFLSPWKTE